MRFFSKPHIFYAKSNILDHQIILFDRPPYKPDQCQNDHDPKEPTRKFVVPATHAHGDLHLHLIRYAVVHLQFFYLVSVLNFEKRVGHENCVALFAYISRNVHAISQPDGIILNPVPILNQRHDLWCFARAHTYANY